MNAIKRSATGIVVSLLITSAALAVQVDLNLWTAESYPAVSGFPAGAWTVNSSGQSVTQVANGQPTLFYSNFNVRGSDVRGSVSVANGGDDDYIGFALGFQPGDTSNAAADYLLVDWKGATQFFDFDGLSTTPGTTAVEGLAVSRVTGVPTADEFWGHTDFAGDPSGGVTELARGATLGSTGWVAGRGVRLPVPLRGRQAPGLRGRYTRTGYQRGFPRWPAGVLQFLPGRSDVQSLHPGHHPAGTVSRYPGTRLAAARDTRRGRGSDPPPARVILPRATDSRIRRKNLKS